MRPICMLTMDDLHRSALESLGELARCEERVCLLAHLEHLSQARRVLFRGP
jgi:hypothetical protein